MCNNFSVFPYDFIKWKTKDVLLTLRAAKR